MPTDTLNIGAILRADLVPYISTWTGERQTRTQVVVRGRIGIGYRHERSGDRDDHGVLWTRYLRSPGAGSPQFNSIHPQRQRHAMRRLLCQVCGGPADQNERGTLWLLGEATQREWPGQELTGQPPVCLRCARPATRMCPHLRRNFLALRVGRAPIVGVFGKLWTTGRHGPFCIGAATVPYDDPQVRFVQARQLMRELYDCTVVDLDEELSD